jgi:ATP-dependent DNA helicase RecG
MRLADLGRKSVRRNALIADLLHRITFIEKAGTGIKRIRDEVRAQGCPEPVFETTGFFTATFFPDPWVRAQVEAQATPEVPPKPPLSTPEAEAHDEAYDEAYEPMSEVERALLVACVESPRSVPELLRLLQYGTRTGNFKRGLGRLVSQELLEMTLADKPRSRKQRYRITAKGRTLLKRRRKES